MQTSAIAAMIPRFRALAAGQPGIALLVLFGSRARGDAAPEADWDFGYVADRSLDPLAMMAAIAEAVGSERIDLVDLKRTGALLRYRAARDGVLVHEGQGGEFDRFRFEAARFWYDAEPVLRPGYDAILDRLG